MGFTPEETHYKLLFEDPQYAGLEVTVRECSVGELTELAKLAGDAQSAPALAKVPTVDRMFTILGESLVEWNLEDRKGSPVPATPAGVRSQSLRLVLAVVQAWMAAVAEVDAPLGNGSGGGETSLELSIPMEPSSPSPGS